MAEEKNRASVWSGDSEAQKQEIAAGALNRSTQMIFNLLPEVHVDLVLILLEQLSHGCTGDLPAL